MSVYPHSSWPPPGPEPRTDPTGQTDGFAIASLVFGILGGVLLSVGFGIAALVRISKGKRTGRGLAIAGLCLSTGWIGVFALVFIFADLTNLPHRDRTGAVIPAGTKPLDDLRIGDCVRLPADLDIDITSLVVVPCSQPHNSQAFTRVPATDKDFYPGEAAVRDGSLDRCGEKVAAFLGSSPADLQVVALYPTATMWEVHTRLSTCLLLDDKADFTGDVRDHG